MSEYRLGDVIDDYCVKCRRITNHSIVSIVNDAAAKVRCRTCYHDHDYRHEQAPPSKKDLKKAELFNEVLAGAGTPAGDEAADASEGAEVLETSESHDEAAEPVVAAPKKAGRKPLKK